MRDKAETRRLSEWSWSGCDALQAAAPEGGLTWQMVYLPKDARRPLPAREPLPPADTTGPAFTEEAIIDAVNAAKTESTVIAHEWSSAQVTWDRFVFTRPGSLHFSPSGGLGWGLPVP